MRKDVLKWAKDKACGGCVYYHCMTHGGTWYCNYILMTGNRRPCRPGKGCTVKLELTRERKRKGETA